MMAGCTPIARYTHNSHALQHVDGSGEAKGFDMVGLGVKLQIAPNVTVEALESYSFQSLHGRHEVFTGSITLEVR